LKHFLLALTTLCFASQTCFGKTAALTAISTKYEMAVFLTNSFKSYDLALNYVEKITPDFDRPALEKMILKTGVQLKDAPPNIVLAGPDRILLKGLGEAFLKDGSIHFLNGKVGSYAKEKSFNENLKSLMALAGDSKKTSGMNHLSPLNPLFSTMAMADQEDVANFPLILFIIALIVGVAVFAADGDQDNKDYLLANWILESGGSELQCTQIQNTKILNQVKTDEQKNLVRAQLTAYCKSTPESQQDRQHLNATSIPKVAEARKTWNHGKSTKAPSAGGGLNPAPQGQR
jgi:hypothetical protein